MSARVQITAIGFTNEYQWGNFGADPVTLMERNYDAHPYVANWGTRRLMIRLCRGRHRRNAESRLWLFRRQVHFKRK